MLLITSTMSIVDSSISSQLISSHALISFDGAITLCRINHVNLDLINALGFKLIPIPIVVTANLPQQIPNVYLKPKPLL